MKLSQRNIYLGLIVSIYSAGALADSGIGVGPITDEVKLTPIDKKLAAEGQKQFVAKCSACHKIEERYVGPALQDVTKRRKPEWIMNMILAPEKMLAAEGGDPTAQDLLAEFLTPMANQNVKKEEARAILEYFRSNDEPKAGKKSGTAKK